MTNERWMMRGSSTLTRTYGEDDRKRLAAEHNNRTGMEPPDELDIDDIMTLRKRGAHRSRTAFDG